MKDFIKGLAFGVVVGMTVGAVIVAKNKKLASKIKEGMSTAEEKLKEAKNNLEEKLGECDCNASEEEYCNCLDKSDNEINFLDKEKNKKSKN